MKIYFNINIQIDYSTTQFDEIQRKHNCLGRWSSQSTLSVGFRRNPPVVIIIGFDSQISSEIHQDLTVGSGIVLMHLGN
jgi:hypothetical protein